MSADTSARPLEGVAVLPRTEARLAPSLALLSAVRGVALWGLRRWWDIRVHDDVFVPRTGPVIIAANHIGTLDGPLAVLCAPRAAAALAKDELFAGVVGWGLARGGQIPLHRDYPDSHALRSAVAVLRAGQPLVIFPEGRRDAGDFDALHGGLAYLALVTGAPVLPCAILGTRLPGAARRSTPPRRHRMDVVFGHPVPVAPQPWPRRRTDIADVTEFLRARLRAHLRHALALTGHQLPGAVPSRRS